MDLLTFKNLLYHCGGSEIGRSKIKNNNRVYKLEFDVESMGTEEINHGLCVD